MTHVYITFNIFLPLQDTFSVGPFKFENCTIGRITRVGANDGDAKEVDSITIEKMVVEKGAVGINVDRIAMSDKVPRYQFHGCTIREVIQRK